MSRKNLIKIAGAALTLFLAVGMSVIPAMAETKDDGTGALTLDTPEYAWWETDEIARWSSVKKANQYQVKLYTVSNPETAVASLKTSEVTADFSPWLKDGERYFFMVRAIPRVSEQQTKRAGDWVTSADQDAKSRGETEGVWRNYLEGNRYQLEDGNYLTAGWHQIRSVWYFFDEEGYVIQGWLEKDHNHYYLGENGAMQTGWLELPEGGIFFQRVE